MWSYCPSGSVYVSVSHAAVPTLAAHLHTYRLIPPPEISLWNITRHAVVLVIPYVLHCHTGRPQRILSLRSACALGSRCAETPGGNAARTFFFFFFTSYRPGKEVGVMHSSGRQKGCESSLSAAPLVPLTPFFTASPSPHLYPVHFACSWRKALAQRVLQKGARGDCELKRDKAWGRELINMFSHILPGSGILAGRRLWVSPSLSPSLCRFTACQRLRFEECPPAVNQRGTHEGEPVRSKHLYLHLT